MAVFRRAALFVAVASFLVAMMPPGLVAQKTTSGVRLSSDIEVIRRGGIVDVNLDVTAGSNPWVIKKVDLHLPTGFQQDTMLFSDTVSAGQPHVARLQIIAPPLWGGQSAIRTGREFEVKALVTYEVLEDGKADSRTSKLDPLTFTYATHFWLFMFACVLGISVAYAGKILLKDRKEIAKVDTKTSALISANLLGFCTVLALGVIAVLGLIEETNWMIVDQGLGGFLLGASVGVFSDEQIAKKALKGEQP